jgi:hypothetical protein
MPDHASTEGGRGLSLPGQPTEQAIAEVGSAAGKSLLRGLARLSNATLSEWIVKREARAEAAKLAVETESKVRTDATLTTARREQELAELEHRAALERRAARLRVELAREQINLETIEKRALEYAESDPGKDNPREMDEDWLFKFADLAQKVSSADVQSLWARALSSAAVEGAPLLSAAALQTLGLLDKDIAEGFRKFVAVAVRLGFVPYPLDDEPEPQQINLATLVDLGLIREGVQDGPLSFEDFAFEGRIANVGLNLLFGYWGLSPRGREIASAVFSRSEDLPLSDELEQQYLRNVVSAHVQAAGHATILPSVNEGFQRIGVRLTKRPNLVENIERPDWKSVPAAQAFSARLRKLLEWAERDFTVELG